MANNSSGMMNHHQEQAAAGVPNQQRSFQQQHHHHHHHLQHRHQHVGGGGDGGAGGSVPSPLIQLQQSQPSALAPYNGNSLVSGALETSPAASATRFQPNLHGMSQDWTPEEQGILEDGLAQYASESSLVRYAKIAALLKNKTVRDVALRCKWMMKTDSGRKRKDDVNVARKNKERKDRVDNSVMTSHVARQPGFSPYPQGVVTNKNRFGNNAIDGLTRDLLMQNAQVFAQIKANLASCQVENNIVLFCQAHDNISHVLKRVHDPPYVMKLMPPLSASVKMNEELANVLSQSNLPMR